MTRYPMVTVDGIDVVCIDGLPIYPSDRENARRIVRHGLADAVEYIGEEVGPKPWQPTHVLNCGSTAFVSSEVYAVMKREATS